MKAKDKICGRRSGNRECLRKRYEYETDDIDDISSAEVLTPQAVKLSVGVGNPQPKRISAHERSHGPEGLGLSDAKPSTRTATNFRVLVF